MREENSTRRRGRLRTIHTDAALHLRLIAGGQVKPLHGNRRSITYQLRKLAEAAGAHESGRTLCVLRARD